MDGKHRGHQGAGPEPAGHLPQHQEEEDRRRSVQQDIGQVMPACPATVTLPVEHVGQRGERVPVAGMEMSEGPDHGVGRPSPRDVAVIVNVEAIIVIDESIPERLAEDSGHGQYDATADGPRGAMPAAAPVTRWGKPETRVSSFAAPGTASGASRFLSPFALRFT